VAHVINSCSTLPGALHKVPEGMTCDDHPELPAAYRVQGETDSFGAELIDMCEACYTEYKQYKADTAVERATGCCDWCKNHATDLRTMRDFEEGSCGRLYDVCGACRKRQNDELEEELRANGHYDNDYDEGPYVDDDYEEDDPEDDVVIDEETQLPVEALPAGSPRAYVDGKYIY
jgi:hypothetical protein